MASLSSKEKEQLQDAVERITDYCVEGMSPNRAIIKTAQEMRLTPDRLPILVNVYNAGATAEHWNSSDSVREKTASFPIADIDEIRNILYPPVVKTASHRAPVAHDEDFSMSVGMMFGDNILDCYKSSLPGVYKTAGYSTRERININAETRENMAVAERQSSEDVSAAMIDAEYCLNKLASVVAKHDMPDFKSLKKTASMVYGRDGENVMAYIEETFPQRPKMTKSAMALRGDHPFHSLMKEAIALTKKVMKAKDVANKVHIKCASMRNKMDERWKSEIYGNPIHRLLLTPAGVNQAVEIEKKNLMKSAANEDLDVPHRTTLLDELTHRDWNGATEREYGILSALDDKEHEARLRNIQTETMFTDLINTDEFLSKQDPEAVLEAYNDIIETTPEMRGKKMVLRQALREYMAQESLDLATIAQLQKMDATERSIKAERDKRREDSVARFADSQQKQRNEDRKFEQEERKLRQEVEQKRLDRAHQLELERRRIEAQAAEGERNRSSSEGIARAQRMLQAREGSAGRQLQEQEGKLNRESNEDINRRTLLAQDWENYLRRQHEKGMENTRHQHAIDLEDHKHGNDTKLENHKDQLERGRINKQEQNRIKAVKKQHDFENLQRIKAEEAAIKMEQERQKFQEAMFNAKTQAEKDRIQIEYNNKLKLMIKQHYYSETDSETEYNRKRELKRSDQNFEIQKMRAEAMQRARELKLSMEREDQNEERRREEWYATAGADVLRNAQEMEKEINRLYKNMRRAGVDQKEAHQIIAARINSVNSMAQGMFRIIPKTVSVFKPTTVTAKGENGQIITDADGNPLTGTGQREKKRLRFIVTPNPSFFPQKIVDQNNNWKGTTMPIQTNFNSPHPKTPYGPGTNIGTVGNALNKTTGTGVFDIGPATGPVTSFSTTVPSATPGGRSTKQKMDIFSTVDPFNTLQPTIK